ncbi:MAG: glycosyltransferase [Bacteroidetes bacterium]|nr:glycosyltransferase [Bacteroidota bacterium]
MSSLSNLPYGKILDYWYEKLSGNQHRKKFIITKMVEVFTFKSYSGRYKDRYDYKEFPQPKYNAVPSDPVFSIVIPAYIATEQDRCNIKNLLSSIEGQTLKPAFIIIVDDCSPIKYEYQGNISVNRLERNSGPAKARNIGKEIALQFRSDIIAFADTDCILNEEWVKTITDNFLNEKQFNILSGNTVSFDNHWYGTYHNINGTLNGRVIKNSDRLLYGTTANLAVTAEVAREINFNENFPFAAGEDIEFCFQANKKGFSIKHVSAMLVEHNFGYSKNPYHSFKKFRSLFKKYGAGEKILLKQVPEYYTYFDQTNEIPVSLE